MNKKGKEVQLCGGRIPFDLVVMDFKRWGMGGATPRLRQDVENLNLMSPALDFAEPVPGREHHEGWFMELNHPDAALIAAAPELLEALERIIDFYAAYEADDGPMCEAAKAAIAKAKGGIES